MMLSKLNRRNLFKVSAIAGGGLMLQLSLPNAMAEEAKPLVASKDLNFYVQIASDGQITIFAPNP